MQSRFCVGNCVFEIKGAVILQNGVNSRKGCRKGQRCHLWLLVPACSQEAWASLYCCDHVCGSCWWSWNNMEVIQVSKHTDVSLGFGFRHTHTLTHLSHELQDFSFWHLCMRTMTPAKIMFQRFCVRDTDTLQVPTHTQTRFKTTNYHRLNGDEAKYRIIWSIIYFKI